MSLFCASRIREREKDTHIREREKRASKPSASLSRRREGTRERKPNLDWKKPPRSSAKGTREISERKTKAKKN
jgi:hypothetical protein